MPSFGYLVDDIPHISLGIPSRTMSPSPSPSPSLLPALELELVSLSLALSSPSFFSAPLSPDGSFVSAVDFAVDWSPLPSPSLSLLVPLPLFSAPPPSPFFRLAQPAVARESLVFRRRQFYLSVCTPPSTDINGLPQVDNGGATISPSTSVLAFRAQREAEDATFMPPILASPVTRMLFPFSPDYVPAFNPDLPLLQLPAYPMAPPLASATTAPAPTSQSMWSGLATSSSLPASSRPLLEIVTSPIPIRRSSRVNFGYLPTRSDYCDDNNSDATSISSSSSSSTGSSHFHFDISDASSSPLPSPRRYRRSPHPSQLNFFSPTIRPEGLFIIGLDSDSESDDE